jgi:UDP:flavonoid glycosyltransferase YjiC (YdhE family)
MVIVPLAADQPDNAQHCASLGVAEVVEPARLSPDTIRVAARTVLRDATYRNRAQQLGGEMRALPDVGRAVELITRIVKDGQPFSAAC